MDRIMFNIVILLLPLFSNVILAHYLHCLYSNGYNRLTLPDSSIISTPSVNATLIREGDAYFPAGQTPEIVIDLTPTSTDEVNIGSVCVSVTNVASVTFTPIGSDGIDKTAVTKLVYGRFPNDVRGLAGVTFICPKGVRGEKVRITLTPKYSDSPVTTIDPLIIATCLEGCSELNGYNQLKLPASSITSTPNINATLIREGGACFPAGPSPQIVIDLRLTIPYSTYYEVGLDCVCVSVTNVASITVTPIGPYGIEKSYGTITRAVYKGTAYVYYRNYYYMPSVRSAKIKITLTPIDSNSPVITTSPLVFSENWHW